MEWYFIVLIVIASITLALMAFSLTVSLYVEKRLVYPRRYTRLQQKEYLHRKGQDSGFETLSRQETSFQMKDGYIIQGEYILIPGSKKFVILVHGQAVTRESSLRFALLFKELGYSCVIYDLRSHGDNIHNDVTMGYKESQDLCQIMDQAYKKFGSDITLGLHGVSMGASSVLLSAQYQQKAAFLISDCAYSSVQEVIDFQLRKYHLYGPLFHPLINTLLKLFHKFSFADCCPLKAVKINKVPTLFIHGEKDTYVPVQCCHELYSACSAPLKEIVLFPQAGHALSLDSGQEKYIQSIKDFIRRTEKSDNTKK